MKPKIAAILNANSLESTSWYEHEVQRHLDVDHRIARENALTERLDDALLDSGDVLTRNHTAFDGVNEFEALACFLAAPA